MGSAGLQWDVADVIAASRMNRKTRFVGTGAQIAGATTYPGMEVYCTTSGSGFIVDTTYERNSADSAWKVVKNVAPDTQYYPISTTHTDYSLPLDGGGSSEPSVAFHDSFISRIGWVESEASNSDIVDGKMMFSHVDYVGDYYKPLGLTLSDTAWVCDFDLKVTGGHNYGPIFYSFCLSAGTGDPPDASQDSLLMGISGDNTNFKLYLAYKDGAGALTTSTVANPSIVASTQYYMRITRLSATSLELKVFSDSARTTQVGTTLTYTIPSTVGSLTHVHVAAAVNGTGSSWSKAGKIDNIFIENGTTTMGKSSTEAQAYDANTGTYYVTNSEATPYYVAKLSTSADKELAAIAIWIPASVLTLTTLRIWYSADDVTYTQCRTILVSNIVTGQYNYIIIPRPTSPIKYVKIDSPDTGILAITEIKFYSPTESQWNRRNGRASISATESVTPLLEGVTGFI